jgi:uncharacterized protein (TIGR03435 family)
LAPWRELGVERGGWNRPFSRWWLRIVDQMAIAVRFLLCVLLATSVSAQPLSFDVASVKPNRSESTMFRLGYPPGRFTATNVTLLALIASAYGPLTANQIVGGPSWITTDRFDVEARTGGDPVRDADGVPQRMQMLQTLLTDRFALVVHRETRELPIYHLRLARDDKRLGPALRAVAADCETLRAARPQTSRPPCAIGGAGGSLIGGAATMSQLATTLSNRVGRVVVDQTGLQGGFDFDLTWTPEQTGSTNTPAATDNSNAPSVFTALREQLGLKLEVERGPVDVLVIDHAAQPAPD